MLFAGEEYPFTSPGLLDFFFSGGENARMSRLVPASWMNGSPRRIIVHWTAGGPAPSAVDVEHYHILVHSTGRLTRGEHAIADNDSCADDDYAAHTRGCNTGAVGVALCGMAGAVRKPFRAGPYPLTRPQWNSCLLVLADLCRRYALSPEPGVVLMHCEVEAQLGRPQAGKWDIERLPFDRGDWAGMSPGEELRARVALLLKETP